MLVNEFNISVDVAKPDIEYHPRAFFLTHTHSDHLQEYFSEKVKDYLDTNGSKIYMTKLSYLFIKHMRDMDEWLLKHIEILNMGTNIVTLPADPEKMLEELHLTVKVLPASHSLGSVMFLFLSATLRVLFTGDFRLTESDVEKYSDFQNRNLDALYIDTTFYLPFYQVFPKRSEIIDFLVKKIIDWVNRGDDYYVGLSTSAATGYEDIFNEIYKRTGMHVYVGDEKKMAFYRAISNKVPGVTDTRESKIHLCHYRVKNNHSLCMGSGDSGNCLKIRFSAMTWHLDGVDEPFYRFLDEKTLLVCYATHCSFNELKYFINYFKCNRIIGHPRTYLRIDESPNCEDIFKDKVNSTYSPKPNDNRRNDVCENTFVPAAVVRNLLTSLHDDE